MNRRDVLKACASLERTEIEGAIELLINLLDVVDGDADSEDGDDAEPEETDMDGDEDDCSHSEDEWSPYAGGALAWDRSGVAIAHTLLVTAPVGRRVVGA